MVTVTSLTATVAIGLVGYLHHRRRAGREEGGDASLWTTLYRTMPLRIVSRLWGAINERDLPVVMRAPLYRAWTCAFGCNLDEIGATSLDEYPNLAEFFGRKLKPGARPVGNDPMVMPCDGRILHLKLYGEGEEVGFVEQVKGMRFSVRRFLGDDSTHARVGCPAVVPAGKRLLVATIYLAPGDYHRFHSPADWTVRRVRHVPGDLLSVNPGVARVVGGLFNFNERVGLVGAWEHGFMSMTAVGATNVGSIQINGVAELRTNRGLLWTTRDARAPKCYSFPAGNVDASQARLKAGEEVGSFRLGSTIVIIAEVPLMYTTGTLCAGDVVRMGQTLIRQSQ